MGIQKHKHRCAVRQMLKYRHQWGLKAFQQYINHPQTRNLWINLQDDFILQWRFGNRGEQGVWL